MLYLSLCFKNFIFLMCELVGALVLVLFAVWLGLIYCIFQSGI
jgi:hypothetical protein